MSIDQDRVEELLASHDPQKVREGLGLIRQEIARLGSEKARPLFGQISALFYTDPLDHPEMAVVLDEAISLVIGFGDSVIPELVENLDQGDLKSQMASAEALSRFGPDAIDPLIAKFEATTNPGTRAFVLYALGKIKSPEVFRAGKQVLTGARSSNVELRDTAVRTMGRFAEVIQPRQMTERLGMRFHNSLRKNLAFPNKGVKAKAIRSLGKLARHGHLSATQRRELTEIALNLLGQDDEFRWDRTYVVRREAAEALGYFQLKARAAKGG